MSHREYIHSLISTPPCQFAMTITFTIFCKEYYIQIIQFQLEYSCFSLVVSCFSVTRFIEILHCIEILHYNLLQYYNIFRFCVISEECSRYSEWRVDRCVCMMGYITTVSRGCVRKSRVIFLSSMSIT